jgi:hypothetical protein
MFILLLAVNAQVKVVENIAKNCQRQCTLPQLENGMLIFKTGDRHQDRRDERWTNIEKKSF